MTANEPDRRPPGRPGFIAAAVGPSSFAAPNDPTVRKRESEHPHRSFADPWRLGSTTAHSAIAAGFSSHDTTQAHAGFPQYETDADMTAMEMNRCIPQSFELKRLLREKREAAFRLGLAWSMLNPGELTKHVRDQYMALRPYAESQTMKAQWGLLARALLEKLSFHSGVLFDFRSASDEQIHSYLSGVGCGFDHGEYIANIVDERT